MASKGEAKSFAEALASSGLANDVETLSDPSQVLGRLTDESREPFGLLVLDWDLPGAASLLKSLRSEERTSELAVIILLSDVKEQDPVESYRLGPNSYLVKPLDPCAFLRAAAERGLSWVLFASRA